MIFPFLLIFDEYHWAVFLNFFVNILTLTWRVDFCGLSSNAFRIFFAVSASVLMRGLPGVDGCNATLNSRLARLAASRSLIYFFAHAAIVICYCIFNAILTNDFSAAFSPLR
ncbi:hypothetical protein L9F63_003657, partial [Diploptera punctata]